MSTFHTHLSWGLMAMELGTSSPQGTFLLQAAGPGWEETGEKPMQVTALQKKGGSQGHGGLAPPLLTHSLALPDCSSWKGGECGYHKAMGGLLGWVGYRAMRD